MIRSLKLTSAFLLLCPLAFVASAEQPEIDGAVRDLFDVNTDQGRAITKASVALDCAAIASRFDSDEEERLLAVGFESMQEALSALRDAADHEGPLEGPFDELREAAAHMAGRQFGTSYELARQDYIEGPEMDLKRFHRELFRERNCAVVGL